MATQRTNVGKLELFILTKSSSKESATECILAWVVFTERMLHAHKKKKQNTVLPRKWGN
jgi:hypothetical protein